MNMYFINLLESMKRESFDESTFVPDISNWQLAKSWYDKYGSIKSISDQKLLDLLYFFYIHENLDYYDNSHFSEVANSIQSLYKINTNSVLNAFIDFRILIYGRNEV